MCLKRLGGKLLGIIFTGGESPPPKIIKQELNEKNTLIIAADSGLITAEKAGIKPDYITGDMDSLPAEMLKNYPPDCIMRHEHDQEYTDTEIALQAAIEKNCEEIWIIGGGGGRIDHLFAIRALFERDVFPSRWLTDTADIRCIDSKKSANSISLNVEKGALVSVFPLGLCPWEAVSSGLKWPLDGIHWEQGLFGLSNIVINENFSITAVKGRFMGINNLGAEKVCRQ
jgi:thiamine pyrophosphokinase